MSKVTDLTVGLQLKRKHYRDLSKTEGQTVFNIQRNELTLSLGGGLVVSLFAFYSDDPISNPSESYSFFCTMLKNNENKKRVGLGYLKRMSVYL